MAFKVSERSTSFLEIDRFDGGVGWIAHPEETMQRASHALEVDGEVWIIDPVDAEGVDDLLAEFGEVAGVVIGLDRHKRDAARVANRHDVNVYLPRWFEGVAREVDAPIVRYDDELADTGIEAHVMNDSRLWQEVALFDPVDRTLVVPESVGTVEYFLAGDERLGVHPMRRLLPPRAELGGFDPERILVGHGLGIHTDAARVLADALEGSRRRTPRLYGKSLRMFVPI